MLYAGPNVYSNHAQRSCSLFIHKQSKEEGNNQESMQLNTKPDQGHRMGK